MLPDAVKSPVLRLPRDRDRAEFPTRQSDLFMQSLKFPRVTQKDTSSPDNHDLRRGRMIGL